MVKLKAGGIILGGLAGYLILSKGIGVIGSSIKNICESHKWKNYYKYGKNSDMVPPGYSVTRGADGQDASNGTPNKASSSAIGEKIVNAIVDAFKGGDAPEEGVEAQETASNKEVCPENCKDCHVGKCPWEKMKNGGVITEWSCEHEPIAGRYPWPKNQELNWFVTDTGGKMVKELSDLLTDVDSALDFMDYVKEHEELGLSDQKIALSLGETVENYVKLKQKAMDIIAAEDRKQDTDGNADESAEVADDETGMD